MILGNKCDMEEKRVVSKERGEAVSWFFTVIEELINFLTRVLYVEVLRRKKYSCFTSS